MTYHPHAHFLVSAGGLSADGQRWLEPTSPKFLVPVHALSLIFRAKMRDALKARGLWANVPQFWRSKKWVVHAKPAGRAEKVLEYLARYVFRIALSNSRLERFEKGQVTFRYRDNRTQQIRRVSLPAAQFLARFLQHVLPKALPKCVTTAWTVRPASHATNKHCFCCRTFGLRLNHSPSRCSRRRANRRKIKSIPSGSAQIGRASCRGRGENSVVAVSLKKKKKKHGAEKILKEKRALCKLHQHKSQNTNTHNVRRLAMHALFC